MTKPKPILVDSSDKLSEMIAAISDSAIIGFDTESSGPNLVGEKFINGYKQSLTGFSVCVDSGQSYYVPVGHRVKNIPASSALQALEVILGHREVWAHNWKWDYLALYSFTHSTRFIPGAVCSYVLSWLLGKAAQSRRTPRGLKQLASTYLAFEMSSYEATAQGKQFSQLTPKQALSYATDDAVATLELGKLWRAECPEAVWEAFIKTEMPFTHLLFEVQLRGIALDIHRTESVYKEHLPRLRYISGRWDKLYPECNIASSKQISERLFDSGDWPTTVSKRTASGWSSSSEVLKKIEALGKSVSAKGRAALLLKKEYTYLSKNLSTYTLSMIDLANQYPDRRLHPQFVQTGTVTGRLSSNSPNAQNLPARSALGKDILSCFVPAPGFALVSADFSQIELRVLAHFAGGMLAEAYRGDVDVHQATADAMGITRDQGKTLNFAVIYGRQAYGLAGQLGVTVDEAQDFLDRYWSSHPHVARLREVVLAAARKRGYVRTLGGRIGYFPHYHSMKPGKERSRIERQIFNLVIQGGAADIVKRAMLNCHNAGLRIISQIHDDIIIETRQPKADAVKLQQCLESAWPTLSVPLVAEPTIGKSFADLK